MAAEMPFAVNIGSRSSSSTRPGARPLQIGSRGRITDGEKAIDLDPPTTGTD